MNDNAAAHAPSCALVVDDDALIRMDAASILEDAGFDTLEAEHADAALDMLQEHHPQLTLLFTDVQMPGRQNGFALASHVAKHWPHISIVVASGHISPGPDDLPEGAHFIGKPFSACIVHEHLKALLPDDQKPAPLRS